MPQQLLCVLELYLQHCVVCMHIQLRLQLLEYHNQTPRMSVLQICEDVPKQLDEEVAGLPDVPSKVLIPRLLHLFSSLHVEAKCLAIGVANLLAGANPESLAPTLDRCGTNIA